MNAVVQTVERDIQVYGVSIHYQTWGSFTTPECTALLIHGLTANIRSWATVGPALANAGWYAIATDLRGRGQSGKPTHGYGIPFHVNDLLSLCDALELPRVALIGHSLGALISFYMAALYPQHVTKAVFVDAGGKVPDDALEAVASSVKRIGQAYPSLDGYLSELRQAAPFQWTDFWEAYYRYDMVVQPDGTATSRMPLHALIEEVTVNNTIRQETLPNLVRAPSLLVRATLGTIAPDKGFVLPREEAERIISVMPDARLVEIPNSNHYTLMLPNEFMQAVLPFLAG